MCCEGTCQEFFELQRQLYPNKADLWDEHENDAYATIEAWGDMFGKWMVPGHVAFPKCLWYHKYFYENVRGQSVNWQRYFDGSAFDDRGIWKE